MRFTTFREMLAFYAGRTPDAPALVFENENRPARLSFSDLLALTDRQASVFKADGGSCLAFVPEASPEAHAAFLGAVGAGLPVVLLDPNAPEEDLAAAIRKAKADRLFCRDGELAEELSGALTGGTTLKGGDICFFTSGTTDKAKAVVLTESSLLASAWNGSSCLPLTPDDILLLALPLNHVFGMVCGFLWGLSSGAAVALGRGIRYLAQDFAFFRPTAVSLVPDLLGFLLKMNALNGELSLVLIGAGACPAALISAVKARGIRVSAGYGLTETGSGVALSLGDDPFAMTVCPDDVVTIAPDGEILVWAPLTMMKGYLDDPEATAAVLRDGVLSTGDLGFLDENGCLHITGRKKEILVLSDGTKIFLPEYEALLAEVLPGRDFAAVLKEGRPALLIHGNPEERDELLKKTAPVLKNMPRGQQLYAILFTGTPLPRTSAGKLKRKEIETIADTAGRSTS